MSPSSPSSARPRFVLPWDELGDAWVRRDAEGNQVAFVWKDSDDPMLDTERKVSADVRLFQDGYVEQAGEPPKKRPRMTGFICPECGLVVGDLDPGTRALLVDCRDLLSLAAKAVETGAFPGPAWRARAEEMGKLFKTLGV